MYLLMASNPGDNGKTCAAVALPAPPALQPCQAVHNSQKHHHEQGPIGRIPLMVMAPKSPKQQRPKRQRPRRVCKPAPNAPSPSSPQARSRGPSGRGPSGRAGQSETRPLLQAPKPEEAQMAEAQTGTQVSPKRALSSKCPSQKQGRAQRQRQFLAVCMSAPNAPSPPSPTGEKFDSRSNKSLEQRLNLSRS